jgi:CheY-like chemotaxis protein/signal transduction histidine kinase
MQGVDILSKELKRVQTRLPREISESKELRAFFEETKGQFKSMRNTNVFMMMTINRVIDFAKATKGLNLLPKLDTIDLMETLNLPLNCMKNIQDRVNIKLMPIDSSTIHNFLITDKQWLQENILCLLSNAVKYSNGGEVTVTVSWQRTARYSNENKPVLSRENSDGVRSYVKNRTKVIGEADFKTSTGNNKQSLYHEEDDDYRPRKPSLVDRIFTFMKTSPSSRMSYYTRATPSTTVNTIVRSFRSVLRPQISQVKPEFLLFEVEDTGIGMSEEVMQSLFSPFKQAQRLAGGTGLGLYSLSKRIEALNGQYGVRKRKDGKEGSLFWFTIPYRPDLSIDASTEDIYGDDSLSFTRSGSDDNIIPPLGQVVPSSHNLMFVHSHSVPSLKRTITFSNKTVETGGSSRVKPLQILLVEDSPTIAKMTSLMLKRSGYEVTLATNGYSALQFMTASYEAHNQTLMEAFERVQEKQPSMIRNDSVITVLNGAESSSNLQNQGTGEESSRKKSTIFDLVLMDFQMPIMDGFEATKRYRELEKQGNYSFQLSLPSTIAATIVEYHLPIIGLTATSDQETIQHGLDSGLDDYLLKPLSNENLQAKIQKYFSLLQIANHHQPSTFNSSLL